MALYKAREKYKKLVSSVYCTRHIAIVYNNVASILCINITHRHSIEWEAILLTMYNELGEEWVPNHRNKLFEKEESLFKKMTEVRYIHTYIYTSPH